MSHESNIPLSFKSLLQKIMAGSSLLSEEAETIIDHIATGKINENLIAAFITAMTMKGESVDEIFGMARGMRKQSLTVNRTKKEPLVDLCGTGGDGKGSFNISTLASFVVAGTGVCVSKHGNRAVTSQCGSADLLEKLGVNLKLTPQQVGICLDEIGIAFLFAPSFHPVMKYIMPVRSQLGFKSVFNILGPLLSPVQADYQLMGVFDQSLAEKISKVFLKLGTKAGMVVHGSDRLDEITLNGITYISEFNVSNDNPKEVRHYQFDPTKYGYRSISQEAFKGGNLEKNIQIAESILRADKPGDPKIDIVVVNAAAALKIVGRATDFKEGITLAQDSLFSGRAKKKLEQLIDLSQKF